MGESNPHVVSDEILHICLMAHLANRPEYRVFSNMNLYYQPFERVRTLESELERLRGTKSKDQTA